MPWSSDFGGRGQSDVCLEHFARRLPGADFKDGVLSLGEGGIHFVDSELRNSKLWIRPCYEHLTDVIREKINDGSKSRFVIVGSPGIGKTMYSYVWLYDLAFEGQRVVYQYNTNTRFLFDWSAAGKQPYVRSGSGEDFLDELMQSKTWFLIDGRANLGAESMRFNAKCILFTCSPNPREYQHFAKPRDALKLYMPVWSETEVMTCRKKVYNDKAEKETLGRFSTYGGLARYIFDKSNVECIVDFKEAMDSFSSFDALFDAVGGSPNPLLYLLLHYFNVTDDNFQYYGFRVEFGSRFLANEVLSNLSPLHEARILAWVEAGVNDIFAGMRRQIRQYFYQRDLKAPKRIRGGDTASYGARAALQSCAGPRDRPSSSCDRVLDPLRLLTYTQRSDGHGSEQEAMEFGKDEPSAAGTARLDREIQLKKEQVRREMEMEREKLTERKERLLQVHTERIEKLRSAKEAREERELERLKCEKERLERSIHNLELRNRAPGNC